MIPADLAFEPKQDDLTDLICCFSQQVKVKREMFGAQGAFECPCYKYSARTDRYIIFMVNLKCTMEKNPQFWTLRGTALLCNTD